MIVDGQLSNSCNVEYGVPQGSVLGPVLFTLYVQPLSDVITSHQCQYQKYADDTELSKSAPVSQFPKIMMEIGSCIDDILVWMISNKLKLNTEKTELMPVGAKARLAGIDCDTLNICGSAVKFQESVKYLGVRIDRSLSMHEQISSTCRAAYLELRRISQLRPYLSEAAVKRLVHALVTSRLDYCNSALAGLPNDQLSRLQRVQNNAARLILKKRRRDHVTPLLRQLHWLPVKSRIDYKLAVFAYRYFDNTLPPYLSAVLSTYNPSRELRSSHEKLLVVPNRNFATVGQRSFSFLAPSVWNNLPCALRDIGSLDIFKSKLKTHLFRKAYGLHLA